MGFDNPSLCDLFYKHKSESMQKFPSKIDRMTDVVLWLFISLPVWVYVSNTFLQGDFGYLQWLFIPTALLMAWFRFATYYIIDETQLTYRSGPVSGSRNIKDIYRIYKTTADPFNSGNLSSDKISIRTKNRSSLNISPERKDEFIALLQSINDQIEVIE